jgi:hypothetical protein
VVTTSIAIVSGGVQEGCLSERPAKGCCIVTDCLSMKKRPAGEGGAFLARGLSTSASQLKWTITQRTISEWSILNTARFQLRVDWCLPQEVTVFPDQPKWRELAEKASTEQDSEKLMALVEELNGALPQPATAARSRRISTAA